MSNCVSRCPSCGHACHEYRTFAEVAAELRRARERFGPMESPEDGLTTLLEEVLELTQAVNDNEPTDRLREEAVQVCAMAKRFIEDCCEEGDLEDAVTDTRTPLPQEKLEALKDHQRLVKEIMQKHGSTCPDCEGKGHTAKTEMAEKWVPEFNHETGEYYEERGHYEQAPYPTPVHCETCAGTGEVVVLCDRFVGALVEPLAATEEE